MSLPDNHEHPKKQRNSGNSYGLSATAAAMDNGEYVTYYADGSYYITNITYDFNNMQTYFPQNAEKKTRSGAKKKDYYNSSNELAWTFYVYGTFTYNGRSAKATDADYSYDIYDSNWSFVDGNAAYSGATATATGQFKHMLSIKPVTLRLTCSADGTLS